MEGRTWTKERTLLMPGARGAACPFHSHSAGLHHLGRERGQRARRVSLRQPGAARGRMDCRGERIEGAATAGLMDGRRVGGKSESDEGMDGRRSVVQVQGDQGRLESNFAVARSETKGGDGYRVDTVRLLVERSLVHRGRGHGGTGAMDGWLPQNDVGRMGEGSSVKHDLAEGKPLQLAIKWSWMGEKKWSGDAWQVQPLCARKLAARGTVTCLPPTIKQPTAFFQQSVETRGGGGMVQCRYRFCATHAKRYPPPPILTFSPSIFSVETTTSQTASHRSSDSIKSIETVIPRTWPICLLPLCLVWTDPVSRLVRYLYQIRPRLFARAWFGLSQVKILRWSRC
jgi:hypothetical protein